MAAVAAVATGGVTDADTAADVDVAEVVLDAALAPGPAVADVFCALLLKAAASGSGSFGVFFFRTNCVFGASSLMPLGVSERGSGSGVFAEWGKPRQHPTACDTHDNDHETDTQATGVSKEDRSTRTGAQNSTGNGRVR